MSADVQSGITRILYGQKFREIFDEDFYTVIFDDSVHYETDHETTMIENADFFNREDIWIVLIEKNLLQFPVGNKFLKNEKTQ